MTITTSKGKTYNVNWAWALASNGKCLIEMPDPRLLSEIAREFEGVERIERLSDTEGDMVWEGYTVLSSIRRSDRNGAVILELFQKEENDGGTAL